MKHSIALLVALFSTFYAVAQQQQPCNCPDQLTFLEEKIRTNYSGFHDKVNPKTQAAYDAFLKKYQAKTEKSRTDTTCARLLGEWTRFFKDNHLQFGEKPKEEPQVDIRAKFAGTEKIAMSEKEVRAYLDQPDRAAIEGIWVNDENAYRVAIIRNEVPPRNYVAFILKADSLYWMPGQVKFELKQHSDHSYGVRYYLRDHSLIERASSLLDGILDIQNLGKWFKQYPGTPIPFTVKKAKDPFEIEKIDDQTVYLRMSTMDESLRWKFDSLMKVNQKLLEKTPNWIIDVRGNGGGSDVTYYPLRPYLYTNPVNRDRAQLYATKDNAEKFRLLAEDTNNFTAAERKEFRQTYEQMQQNEGKFIGDTGVEIEKLRAKSGKPERVAVIMDKGCASSCEEFVLFAQQSKKTTLMGVNTSGTLDYGNLHRMNLPCDLWEFVYPTSRSCRVDTGRGIDNIGIPPAVNLNKQTDEWVLFAHNYLLEQGKKK
jgi:hypothetical protein